jgi:tetratricopeptide (TPR) repeat protein
MVAALFALHPLHVESVAWVAERKDVLSTFFLLLTLGAYRRYTLNPGGFAYVKVLLLFMLGLMAKPMLVTLPLVLLILDFWPLDRLTRQNGDETAALLPVTLLLEKVPFAIIAGSAAFIAYKAQQSWGATEALNRQDLWSNIGNVLTSYGQYLYLTFFPFKLAVLYPYHTGTVYWKLLLCAAIIIALSAAAAFAIRTRPYLLAGWLWFFITLLPVSGIINIGFHDHADRYTYIPLIGVFMALVWFVADFCDERGWSRWSARLGIAVVLIVATATGLQVRYWKNSYTLFMHAIEVTTGNWLAHQHVSQYLLQSFRIAEAGDHIEASIRINPDNPNNYFILGSICRNLKQPDKAIRALEQGVALNPYKASELSNLGVLYADNNRIDEAQRIAGRLNVLDPVYANSLQTYIHNRQRSAGK